MADKPDRALAGKLLDFKAVERGSELLNGPSKNKRRIASLRYNWQAESQRQLKQWRIDCDTSVDCVGGLTLRND